MIREKSYFFNSFVVKKKIEKKYKTLIIEMNFDIK
jgi:hypothetical protein